MTTNDATDRVRQDWDSQANQWFEQREALFAATRPLHEWMLAQLQPRGGQRVLEIAAGPGDTGFLVASLLGDGRLVSTDLSPSMVDAAQKRGRELGITNADYRTLDAQSMDLPSSSFDGVICRWGFMLMPDPAAAFRESMRVLVPGGRLVFAVFTGPDKNPFASIPARILVEMGHLPPPAAETWRPGILALADRTRLESLLDSAGFVSVRIEPVVMSWTFDGADGYWRFLIELTALGPLVRSLPDDARARFREVMNERLAPFAVANGIALPSECWGGVAFRSTTSPPA
jgi:ubiquinone/menaquinone biosynthesis C-methylase UbiE